MNVFEFRQTLVNEYAQFTRSFTRIKADDIRAFVDAEYASQKYWPEPLIQVNPNFQPGGSVESLCEAGQLNPQCAEIFRFGKTASSAGQTLPLYKHQVEAISLASAGESYVLTTGTGSGKSLSYFIPIVDACLAARLADPTPRTRAIVVYPMNALANSQLEELKKFLGADPDTRAVTFGRFTGQESTEEREAMKANPPDILLTNFMMLELLLTRQNAIDQQVIANAKGLRFLVLDDSPADLAYIVPRVLELTHTAHDMQAWADDLLATLPSADPRPPEEHGTPLPPFPWNPERRAQLRAELDAYYARLYGLDRDELRYILDPAAVMGADYPSETFRVLKNSELREFGEYRTQRLVLAAWDALEVDR